MKKRSISVITMIMVLAFSTNVAAANPATEKKTTDITTRVDPTYTVTIPANTAVAFNKLTTDFGEIKVDAAQIHPDKSIQVVLDSDKKMENTVDSSKVIPYTVKAGDATFTSSVYTKTGDKTSLTLSISQDAWNQAYAGNYSDTLTFTISYIDRV